MMNENKFKTFVKGSDEVSITSIREHLWLNQQISHTPEAQGQISLCETYIFVLLYVRAAKI